MGIENRVIVKEFIYEVFKQLNCLPLKFSYQIKKPVGVAKLASGNLNMLACDDRGLVVTLYEEVKKNFDPYFSKGTRPKRGRTASKNWCRDE